MFGNTRARRLGTLGTGLAVSVLLLAGCEVEAPTELELRAPSGDRQSARSAGSPGELDPDLHGQLADLRKATAPYHDPGNAVDDGWEVRFPPECLRHAEEGAMGTHLLNPALIQDEEADRIQVTRPEFLVYEPGPAGAMRLVAVEYVVPFSVRPSDADPPSLFGHDFHPNQTYEVWAFHVWIWRPNPNGIFADWNPRVSCEHGETVRTFPEE